MQIWLDPHIQSLAKSGNHCWARAGSAAARTQPSELTLSPQLARLRWLPGSKLLRTASLYLFIIISLTDYISADDLPINPETLTIGTSQLRSQEIHQSSQRTYKNKVEEHFTQQYPRSMWQGINNITGFKGNKPATVTLPPLYRTSSTPFMLGSRQIPPLTQRALPRLLQKRWSPLTLSVADVTRSFKTGEHP